MQTCGVVVKEIKFGEGDKIVTFLTDVGMKKAVVRRRIRGVQIEPFWYGEVLLAQGKGDLPYVKECRTIKRFFDLRYDVFKIALAEYFAEVSRFTAQGDDLASLVKLILNSYHKLCIAEDIIKIKSVFELRWSVLLGFMPNLLVCTHCGNGNNLLNFSVLENGVICEKCKGGQVMSAAVLEAMRYIVHSLPEKVFSFEMEKTQELTNITEQILVSHIGRIPESLEYFNKLL